jgi:3-isopropylmalate/(R)-2-methylmalate dehydratase large subunit
MMAQDMVDSRAMVKKYGVKHLYDMGTGNGHILMLERGHVYPGGVFVGADSHSTIYGAVGGFGTALSYEVPEIALSGKAWFKVPKTMRVNMEGSTKKGVCARDVVHISWRCGR